MAADDSMARSRYIRKTWMEGIALPIFVGYVMLELLLSDDPIRLLREWQFHVAMILWVPLLLAGAYVSGRLSWKLGFGREEDL